MVALALIAPAAHSATKKPTPTPSRHSQEPVSVKASAKPSVKTSAKPSVKATTTKKAIAKKKVKPKPRKKITLSPSPSPKWPPLGFKVENGLFAKVPTSKELVGIASNGKVLTAQLAQQVDGVRICEKYSCGAIQVASLTGCTWWEITARVVGVTSVADTTPNIFGSIRTTAKRSLPQQILTILLISGEDLTLDHAVTGFSVTCHRTPATEKVPSNVYTPTEIQSKS